MFCKLCGKEIEKDSDFCPGCGAGMKKQEINNELNGGRDTVSILLFGIFITLTVVTFIWLFNAKAHIDYYNSDGDNNEVIITNLSEKTDNDVNEAIDVQAKESNISNTPQFDEGKVESESNNNSSEEVIREIEERKEEKKIPEYTLVQSENVEVVKFDTTNGEITYYLVCSHCGHEDSNSKRNEFLKVGCTSNPSYFCTECKEWTNAKLSIKEKSSF